MKKTIIALFALAGVAAAESLDYDTYKSVTLASPYLTDLYTVWDFDQVSGTQASKVGGDMGGYSNTPVIAYESGNESDGYGVVNSDKGRLYKSGMSLGNFTISVDVNTMTAGHLLTLKDSSDKYIYLTSSSTAPLTLTYDDVTGSVVSAVKPTSSDETLNWTTITLTRSSDILTLYVNGVSQGTLKGSDTSIAALQLGNRYEGGTPAAPIDATVDNLTIWDRALTTEEVQGFIVPTQSVPEPTTATLSLLALAGLAARRRRK